MNREHGFTLAELIVVLTGVALAATVAIPQLLSSRLAANEAAAAATLREITTAEMQFRKARRVDLDDDGRGEFGYLKELSAVVGVRTAPDGAQVGGVVDPPFLAPGFRAINAHGELMRSGYLFHVFLPGKGGVGVGETELFPVREEIDSDLAATTWCCYAWPVRHATSGNRTFFAHPSADVVQTDAPDYGGLGRFDGAGCGSAFVAGPGPLTGIVGTVAVGTRGRDGRLWRRAE
jgi:hypothetical protein